MRENSWRPTSVSVDGRSAKALERKGLVTRKTFGRPPYVQRVWVLTDAGRTVSI